MSNPEVLFYFEDAVLRTLREEVSRTPVGQGAWARKAGISPQYLSHILRGKSDISERVAAILGFRKFPAFEWIGDQVDELHAGPEVVQGPVISEFLDAYVEGEM